MKNITLRLLTIGTIALLSVLSCKKNNIKPYFYSEKQYRVWGRHHDIRYYIYHENGRLDVALLELDSTLIAYNIMNNDLKAINDPNNKWSIKGDTLFEGLDTFFPFFSKNNLYFTKDSIPYFDYTDNVDYNGDILNPKCRFNSKGFDVRYNHEINARPHWISRESFNELFLKHKKSLLRDSSELNIAIWTVKFDRLEKKNPKYNSSKVIRCGISQQH